MRKYGSTGLENLYGPGCSQRLRALLTGGRKATCVVKYSASLDQPLELPAVPVFQPNHHYWGSQTPASPPRERGTTWSKVSSGAGKASAQYWHSKRSRRNTLKRVKAT